MNDAQRIPVAMKNPHTQSERHKSNQQVSYREDRRGKRAVTIATYVSAGHLVANDEPGDTVCYSSSSRGEI
ncbi:hypothetical protein CEXT_745951 [Caerostris extrusa]|uniref:Uncharacterized protein n=1 Tax=Caerostris extrusa TaxID=172846 RepID=A0AAV4VXK2_CAEEX|nr:hypothetical protein CEXT_745951 [Caerostris extrusa]